MWFAHMFRAFALAVSEWTGRPVAFALALACVIVWAATGPIVGYTDLWQLTINTATTIVTFLMVFLIQNSQNCDTKAVQIKLDELIRVTRGARNDLIDVEALTEEEIAMVAERYALLADKARNGHKKNGGNATGVRARKKSRKTSTRRVSKKQTVPRPA